MNVRLREVETELDGFDTGFAPGVDEVGLDGLSPRGLLPKLAAGPAALSRSSRRMGRTSAFLFDAAHHVKRRLLPLREGPVTSLRRQGYLAYMSENICAVNGFEVRTRGQLPTEPSILLCNHVGWQDPLLVMSQVPAIAVAKHEVGAWPLLGEMSRGLDILLVDRACAHSGAKVLLRAKTLLERGASVLTFPEGTTTTGHDILPFKRGMFGLAQLMGLPVRPIALRYHDEGVAWVGNASFFPHYIKTTARKRTVCTLDFGPPLYAGPRDDAEAFAERARRVMLALLNRGSGQAGCDQAGFNQAGFNQVGPSSEA